MMTVRISEEHKLGAIGVTRSGLIQRNTLPPSLVKFAVIDDLAIYEGDIILGRAEDFPESNQNYAAAVSAGDQFRWRNGVIPYQISPNLPSVVGARVADAIQHWQNQTSIRFILRTNERDFITFQPSNGCSSSLGRKGGEQVINIADWATIGNVIHEIGHAVGLWHEQSREDRDRFVSINERNIVPDMLHNFNQHISDGDDVGPYDYDSIMHYGEFSWCVDKSIPTIVTPRDVGQRNALSVGDIAAVRCIYYFQRRGDSANSAGCVLEIGLIRHRSQKVLTAVTTADKILKLISWQVNDDGSVSRLGDSGAQAGVATDIDIARGSRYVVAFRTAQRKLKLISWNVSDGGAITRAGDSGDQAGEASLISVIALTDRLFITAFRTTEGRLRLISWQLNANGSLARLADSGNSGGDVTEISVVNIPISSAGGGRLVTSVATSDGKLKLIVWSVLSTGTIVRLGDSDQQGGAASMIRSARDSHGHILTSVRSAEGSLTLNSWSISQDGRIVNLLSDSGIRAGAISDNALMSRAPGVISAVRTTDGVLKLIAWKVSETGWISRAGDSYNLAWEPLAGDTSLITLCQESLSDNSPIVSAMKTADGNLKMITWHDGA